MKRTHYHALLAIVTFLLVLPLAPVLSNAERYYIWTSPDGVAHVDRSQPPIEIKQAYVFDYKWVTKTFTYLGQRSDPPTEEVKSVLVYNFTPLENVDQTGIIHPPEGGTVEAEKPDKHTSPGQDSSSKGMKIDMNEIAKQLELTLSWDHSGFGAVMLANFTITNRSDQDVKDIQLRCDCFSKTDVKLQSIKRTIYDFVPSKTTSQFEKVNMGFVNSQVEKVGCAIYKFALAREQ